MEIPAGKWCTRCTFQDWIEDGDEHCRIFDKLTFHDRLPACLSAYPNGAVIEIKPK